ncbi:P-selectin glycoprotein ligand 1 [Nibea albiflora]|uniref:P-selectin glycoprotein ligand 1 n=1 Tax=Nibea albiflora TaxID=240163 RepID=A0ACB7F8R8_NIBAL|nr:P-selectin glycoprotein ligand 1 [Nibea albiflora]
MMLLSMKTCLALLWGISLLFSTESVSASTSGPSSMYSTAEPNDKTTKEVINANVGQNETETHLVTSHPTHKPAEVSVSATPAMIVTPTMKKEDAIVTYIIHRPNDITTSLVAMDSAAATTASSSAPQLLHTSTAVNEAATPSTSSSIASLDNATQTSVLNQTFSSPSASTAATTSANLTFATTNSTELSSKSQPVSVTSTHIFTSEFTGTAGLSSTTEPTTTTTSQTNSTNTTAASNSTILIPRVPKRLPIPTSKSTPATTTVSRGASSNTEAKTCSTRGVVKQCLIAIASLAALATIFMVSTIVLCTKLSARKYKVTKPQTATEMMCISSLLPEREYIYTRQRNPVSNGVLVMHHGGDSDEDAGDNLTLSSFLPDNDRYV